MKLARLLVVPAIAAALVLTSCEDEPTPLDLENLTTSMGLFEGTQGQTAQRVTNLIEALYPDGGLENAALNRWNNVQRQFERGRTAAAQSQMRILADQVSSFLDQGRLLDPDPELYPDLPSSAERAAAETVTWLFVFVGLDAGDALEEYPDALPEDVGVGVVDPDEEATVTTGNAWAAVVVDPGDTDETVFITIELLEEETCEVADPLTQAQGCWDIDRYPEGEWDDEVEVEICVADNPELTDEEWDRLLVHHKDETTGEVTVLPWAEPTTIDCTGFGEKEAEPVSLSPVASALRRVGGRVASLLLPQPLAASFQFLTRPPRGIGGLGTEFSEFFGATSDPADVSVGTGPAVTWEMEDPTVGIDLCGQSDPLGCSPLLETEVELTAVATGPSGTFIGPWARVYFYHQPHDGSAPATLIGEAGAPTINDEGVTRYYTWSITLEGAGLELGPTDVFAIGVLPDGGPFRTPANSNITVRWEPEVEGLGAGAGKDFSCALRSDGKAFCWGYNYFGELGDGTQTDSPTPVEVKGGHTFVQLHVTDHTVCGLTASGAAYCWGYNRNGLLGAGLPQGEHSLEPVPVAGGHSFVFFDMSYSTACGIADDGITYCWGRNRWGAVGNGTSGNNYNVPVPVTDSGTLGFVHVSTTWRASCGLTGSGSPYCWGLGYMFGNDPQSSNSFTPTSAVDGTPLMDIDGGTGYFCSLDGSHDTYCWGGYANVGSLGNGTTQPTVDYPTLVVGGHSFASIETDDTNTSVGSTCGLTAGGEAWCWGANQEGQLGGTSSDVCDIRGVPGDCALGPIPVSGGHHFASIDVGYEHMCGLDDSGAMLCWGNNDHGQLGDGTLDDSPVPVYVGPLVEAPGPGPIVVTPYRDVIPLIESTLQLEAVAYDGMGSPLPTQPTFTWESSDPSVASVDATGAVTAWSDGTVIISVEGSNGAIGRTTVIVSAADPVVTFTNALVGSGGGGVILLSGLLGDEWIHAGSYLNRPAVDQRNIANDNQSVEDVYNNLHFARTVLEWEANRPGTAYPVAELKMLAGFTYLAFAENWCSGVPLDDPDVGLTTTDLFTLAVTSFEEAITSDPFSDYAMAAHVGNARALIGLGDFAGAVAQAAQVPTAFAYDTDQSSLTNGIWYNGVDNGHLSVADGEGANGLSYRTPSDPRVPSDYGGLGLNGMTPWYRTLKYPAADSPVALASGTEARLIQAEHYLRQGDFASMLSIINELRASVLLTPLTIPFTYAEAQDLLFGERAFWLYGTGHRLWDMRRLINDYGRGAASVFPVGPYHTGGSYGTDANLPVPEGARGPGFTGCTVRGG